MIAILALIGAMAAPAPGGASRPDSNPAPSRTEVKAAIERHLGRPYAWGATGLKSFDCSGFVWRVMQEDGLLIKRTTARKLYYSLPRVAPEGRWDFGNIVFFDHLTHCGIVDSPDGFYHAAVSVGTHRSSFDPFWRGKIDGVRAVPWPARAAVSAPSAPRP